MAEKSTPQMYQMKVTLRDSKPPIWRRLLLSSDITLAQLHHIIQVTMGWEDAHLHQFEIGEDRYGLPLEDIFNGPDYKDSRRFKLSKFVTGEGFKFTYQYDFGDSWDHTLLVEKILPINPQQKLPVCIKGKRACPPEDVGGIWSYDYFLEAIQDPNHSDHENYLEWVGESFDPEAFDLNAINEKLGSLL